MKKDRTVRLSKKEIGFLKKKRKGKLSKRVRDRIDILLLCNKGKTEMEISEFLDITRDTIWRTKVKYQKGGLEVALNEAYRSGQPRKYTQKHATEITAIACSEPPDGAERWTMELLTAHTRSTVGGCEKISKETVRLMLKKTLANLG